MMTRMRDLLMRVRDLLRSFARSRDGGAILVGGAFVLAMMAGVGGWMTNYAWREAQWEELRAATRAAVSTAGPLLAGAGGATDEQIRERVAGFVSASMPGLTVTPEDVIVSYDAETDTTTIVVGGNYKFDDIWVNWGGRVTAVESVVKVQLQAERYEVAMALDVSHSMGFRLSDGVVKLDALKAAVTNVVDTLDATGDTTPGSVLVSMVPYSSAVNVADTCNRDPDTGVCRAGRSASKERYVRMVAGVRETMAETLADARYARDNNVGGHWVDTFHHYGAGTDLGSLRRQYLPMDLLEDREWNLRRTAVDIDVPAQLPGTGVWTVDDEDFWNGCVMARWGAYWVPAARPPGWTQDDDDNWPATMPVAAWSQGASALPADTPLHLSDAPPSDDVPSTLFTAFSWPDARIRGQADGRLQDSMIEMLQPGVIFSYRALSYRAVGDNDWSLPGNGGSRFCPPVAITPLTEDLGLLREVADDLRTTDVYVGAGQTIGATYMNLGIIWGLRTLSPLWQGVWDVRDVRNTPRPAVPCAPGEQTVGCDPTLTKSILLVSDGASWVGGVAGSRLLSSWSATSNPGYNTEPRCRIPRISSYHSAAATPTPSEFNSHFRVPQVDTDLVDSGDRLNAAGRERLVDAVLGLADPGPDTPTRRASMLSTLASAASGVPPTPWQLFRGLDAEVIDALVDEGSAFGFDGRPILINHRCRPSSTFSPYGRADDMVYVGDVGTDASSPPRPIGDVAPFEVNNLPESIVGDGTPGSFDRYLVEPVLSRRIDDWFLEACRIAGARRVRINAVFIGDPSYYGSAISVLEQCVDSAGGEADTDEVFVVPTSAALSAAFDKIFTIRRNLRFLN